MLDYAKAAGGIAGFLFIFAIALIIVPWLFFWSTGQLFGIHIELNFWNWLGAVVFLACIRGGK